MTITHRPQDNRAYEPGILRRCDRIHRWVTWYGHYCTGCHRRHLILGVLPF